MVWPPGIQRGSSMNQAAKIGLITTEYTQNALGEWEETRQTRNVFAYVSSVGMNEFYQAGMQGFKPEYRFLIWLKEYENEEVLEYQGDVYAIYRTYLRDDGRIELYVTKRKGEEES